ncbi:PadR family transcriptional regulator [Sorangium sp. So ce233]|uniref:PadR family transcriptional regulator n=1 Tax=Sorangium sp. So ce233 TaxID=3133290 RepID=UPI003F623239
MDALSAKAVLLQELCRGPGFGLELIERVRAISGGAVTLSQGSVYTALRDLEAEGLVASAGVEARGDRGGRPRQVYRITDAGRRVAEEHSARVVAVYGGCPAERRRERCGTAVEAEEEREAPAVELASRWVEPDG